MVKQAVILAGGLGTRMQENNDAVTLDERSERLAGRGLKMLIEINGRPFLDYVVDSLMRVDIKKIAMVIPPRCPALEQYAGRVRHLTGARFSTCLQASPRGTADAVLAAKDLVCDENFLLCNSDNLYGSSALRRLATVPAGRCAVAAFEREALLARSNIEPGRVKDFAIIEADPDGSLLEIVEKPPNPEKHTRGGRLWVNMNLYVFTPHIFDACSAIAPDPERGELELTGAVEELIRADHVPFKAVFVEDSVLDLTSKKDVPQVQRALSGRKPVF